MAEFQASQRVAEARRLHDTVAVADGHNDLPWAIRCMEPVGACGLNELDLRANNTGKRFGTNHGCLHTDIPRLREGGVGWQFWSVYVPATVQGGEAVLQTVEQIDFVHRIVEKYSDTFEFAYSADDIERIRAKGKIASMCGMEGGHQIGNSLASLRMMYKLAPNNGLSDFGKEVVLEMNRIGMLVDLSHVHHVTMQAAIEISKAPVIFSHSSSRALCAHPRDVPDNILAMLPANGGIIMVTFVASFIAGQFWVKDGKVGATVVEVADHIDHIRNIAGIDHIGIGGDYDGCTDLARGLEDVSGYPLLTAELMNRGYTDEDLRKILGGNILRVLRVAEHYSQQCCDHGDLPSERLYSDGD
eukprot:GSChrysophyteH1.ASY1.ANO1.1071.1 assembled CDS